MESQRLPDEYGRGCGEDLPAAQSWPVELQRYVLLPSTSKPFFTRATNKNLPVSFIGF